MGFVAGTWIHTEQDLVQIEQPKMNNSVYLRYECTYELVDFGLGRPRTILLYQDDESYLARVIGHCGVLPETLIKQDERDYLYLDKRKDRDFIALYDDAIQ